MRTPRLLAQGPGKTEVAFSKEKTPGGVGSCGADEKFSSYLEV